MMRQKHVPNGSTLGRYGAPGYEQRSDGFDLTLEASGLDQVNVVHRPRLLSELP